MVLVRRFGAIRRRRPRIRIRMRVVEADDVQSARASFAPGANVIRRVDQKTRWVVCEIGGANGSNDLRSAAEEQSAALSGCRLTRVSDDVVANGTRKDHSVST